eukprot:1871187-Karenia_brevis.AAC.1
MFPPRQLIKVVLVIALLVLGLKLVVVGYPSDLHDVIAQGWQITIGSVIWKGLAVLQDGNMVSDEGSESFVTHR